VQVHKIRDTNFVDLFSNEMQSLCDEREQKKPKGTIHEILHENGKVGRVTFFLKNELIALDSYKISYNTLHSFGEQ
jgi:hypothetical protein